MMAIAAYRIVTTIIDDRYVEATLQRLQVRQVNGVNVDHWIDVRPLPISEDGKRILPTRMGEESSETS